MDYYIGMHEEFDSKKYDRDFHKMIKGIEFCNFTNENEMIKAWELSVIDDFKIGIHFPFLKENYKYRDPFISSTCQIEREEAFYAVEKELRQAAKMNAEYLLIHFPKPMILDLSHAWEKACTQDYEVIDEKDAEYHTVYELAEYAISRLHKLSKEYEVDVILELDLINKWFYETDLLEHLLSKYDGVKLCLDSARLHVIEKIDPSFDSIEFAKKVSRFTSNLHLSNVQVKDTLYHRHHPVFPINKIEDGWSDVEAFLNVFKGHKQIQRVLFEHQSTRISELELKSCYEFVMTHLSE
jgi:sugar phosphate isomerase/epimerase